MVFVSQGAQTIQECDNFHWVQQDSVTPALVASSSPRQPQVGIADLGHEAWVMGCREGDVQRCQLPGCDWQVWNEFRGFKEKAPEIIFLHFGRDKFWGDTTPTKVRSDTYTYNHDKKLELDLPFFINGSGQLQRPATRLACTIQLLNHPRESWCTIPWFTIASTCLCDGRRPSATGRTVCPETCSRKSASSRSSRCRSERIGSHTARLCTTRVTLRVHLIQILRSLLLN